LFVLIGFPVQAKSAYFNQAKYFNNLMQVNFSE